MLRVASVNPCSCIGLKQANLKDHEPVGRPGNELDVTCFHPDQKTVSSVRSLFRTGQLLTSANHSGEQRSTK